VSGENGESPKADLQALWAKLGLPQLSISSSPLGIPPAHVTPLTLNIDGLEISVLVPDAAKQAYRQTFKVLARREKRRAADAGNAANTSILVCGSLGAPLATSGVIALSTSPGPPAILAILATGTGGLIALGGLFWAHWMNKKKFAHEERLEQYLEVVEEMK